jgi:outer membrane protein TolC
LRCNSAVTDSGAARAGKNAALLSYRQTVLNAFAEVEDALSNQAAEQTRYESIDGQVAADARAVDERQQRYRNGEVSFLPVLDTQRNFMQRRTLRSAAP